MDLTINQRLRDFLEYKNISFDAFRKSVSVGRIQQVSGWMNLRERIPEKVLIEVVKVYYDLNPRWLFFGEGTMINNGAKNPVGASGKSKIDLDSPDQFIAVYKDYVNTLKNVIRNLETAVETQRESFVMLKEKTTSQLISDGGVSIIPILKSGSH